MQLSGIMWYSFRIIIFDVTFTSIDILITSISDAKKIINIVVTVEWSLVTKATKMRYDFKLNQTS